MIRIFINLFLFIIAINSLVSVDFCNNFKIVSVLDIPPAPLTPGGNCFLLTLTVKEDNPGSISNYASIYFTDEFGDTVSIPTGPSSTLPVLKSDTIPYILKLKTEKSNQDFPSNFSGQLIIEDIGKEICEVEYSNVKTNVEEVNTNSTNSNLVKYTSIYDINGKLLITSINSTTLDYNHLESGFYILIKHYENGKRETKKLVIN